LIDTVAKHRAGEEVWGGFAAWYAIVGSCADEHGDLMALLWIARVVHHDLGGNPLDSVARWTRDTMVSQGQTYAHQAGEARQRARERLANDPDRIRAHPEVRLRAWERSARPIRELVDVPLDRLGVELARSVLVDPHQPRDAARSIVARLGAALPASPEARLPIADALCALSCIGVELPEIVRGRIRSWVPSLTAVEPPLPGRVRGALVALAHYDLPRANYVAPEPHRDELGNRVFPTDMLAVVSHLITAVRERAPVAMVVDETFHRIGEELDDLCERGLIDEPTVLWLARVMFHTLDRRPLAEIAAHAHDWLWSIPDELEEIRRASPTRTRPFPFACTLGNGAYRFDQWLAGMGGQRLYRGVEVVTGRHVVIAMDDHKRQEVAELAAAVSYKVPGVLEPAYVGTFDGNADYWATVEHVPPGDWLPRVLGPADPWTAPRKAIELALSAGRILLRAAEAGHVLAQIRPEMMWMTTVDGRHEVTGLSTRGCELFSRYRGDAVTRPIFVRDYRAPEVHDLRVVPDDRSVAFSLAAMIAHWATGRFPLRDDFSQTRDEHVPLDMPAALRDLVLRTMVKERNARPPLAELVDALARLRDNTGS
jgi:hypothetical protein